jgi:hypothetical protein
MALNFGLIGGLAATNMANAAGRNDGGRTVVIDRTTHYNKDNATFDKRVTTQEMTFTDEAHEKKALQTGDLTHVEMGAVHRDTVALRSGATLTKRPWHRAQLTAPDGKTSHLGFLTHVQLPQHSHDGSWGELELHHPWKQQRIKADGVTVFGANDGSLYEVRPDNSAVYMSAGTRCYRDAHAQTRPDGRIEVRDAANSALVTTIKPLLQQRYFVTAEMQASGKNYPSAKDLNHQPYDDQPSYRL